MARITINNLPVMQELKTEELKGIFGGAAPVGMRLAGPVSGLSVLSAAPVGIVTNALRPEEPVIPFRVL